MFESRELRKIFGPKQETVTGDWRRLHNEELHVFHLLPVIVRMSKSMRMRWVGHAACMGEDKYIVFRLVNLK